MAHEFTTNRQPSLDAIGGYRPVGGTALYDALGGAFAALKRVEGRRAVVVMTDGRDENNAGTAPGSRQTLAQMLDSPARVDATVLPIGLGTNLDREGLERLAEISGGRRQLPRRVSGLRDQFADGREPAPPLRARLHVDQRIAGRLVANVEIRSRSTKHVIRSRSGYFAPER